MRTCTAMFLLSELKNQLTENQNAQNASQLEGSRLLIDALNIAIKSLAYETIGTLAQDEWKVKDVKVQL